MIKKNCLICHKEFIIYPYRLKQGGGKFCSKKCYGISQRDKIKRNCKYCKKEFFTIKSDNCIFCSQECMGKWNSKHIKGINHHNWKGGEIKRICQICGKRFNIAPSRIKAGMGKFCSNHCYGIWISKNRRGKNNPSWKGGICSENEKFRRNINYKIWRKKVFERDGYSCIICGKIGVKLNAHHIKSFAHYPKLRLDINNGITMCEKCHKIGRKENPLFYQN